MLNDINSIVVVESPNVATVLTKPTPEAYQLAEGKSRDVGMSDPFMVTVMVMAA